MSGTHVCECVKVCFVCINVIFNYESILCLHICLVQILVYAFGYVVCMYLMHSIRFIYMGMSCICMSCVCVYCICVNRKCKHCKCVLASMTTCVQSHLYMIACACITLYIYIYIYIYILYRMFYICIAYM